MIHDTNDWSRFLLHNTDVAQHIISSLCIAFTLNKSAAAMTKVKMRKIEPRQTEENFHLLREIVRWRIPSFPASSAYCFNEVESGRDLEYRTACNSFANPLGW